MTEENEQEQADRFNGLIQRYQRQQLSSVEFHREWLALGAPPADMLPEGWSEVFGPERPEECDNLDQLEGWWQVERQGHLVPGYGGKVPPSPNTKASSVAIYLIVSVLSVVVALPYGWPVVLPVLVVMALLIFPLRREIQHNEERANRYELAHADYRQRRTELLESSPEELRWDEARLEDLAQLNNRADVERWWRHARRRLQFQTVADLPFRPTRSNAMSNLIMAVPVGLIGIFPAWLVGRNNLTLGCLIFLVCLGPVIAILLSCRKEFRAAQEYNLAESAYQERLVALGEEPDW